ncbi:hypothetical protein DTO271D3_5146 [Paecilomyces variotii]|nr:hypothetical protein DTO271D3_5146 [Paecilomyces variotii]
MADKVRQVALEEAQQLKSRAQKAVRSGAWLYPFRGIIYFLTHRSLWQPLLSRIVPTITLGLSITSAMFFFTYVPQAAMLAFTSGPLAPISAALLVLSESSTITSALSRSLLLQEALVDTFDGTLLSRGQAALVANTRQLKSGSIDPIYRLGKLIKKPFARFSPRALIRSVLYLPLNFIPVVGSIAYILIQGKKLGPVAHERYFQMKGWNARQKEEWVEKNKAAYTSFGVAAFVLEMIPFASLAFAYTNTVGAAIWATDIEKSESTAPGLREQAEKAK